MAEAAPGSLLLGGNAATGTATLDEAASAAASCPARIGDGNHSDAAAQQAQDPRGHPDGEPTVQQPGSLWRFQKPGAEVRCCHTLKACPLGSVYILSCAK